MRHLSKPRRINIALLLVAAAGLVILFAASPDRFPAIPPGPILLAVVAALVAFVPGRVTQVLGVVLPLAIFIGGIATGGSIDILGGSDNAGAVVGTVIQMPALLGAAVAGALALTREDA